jgi:hypothetical protein
MKTLGQYNTPLWVAEALVERHFPDLSSSDLVCEPSCGPGTFLRAIPANIPAFVVEIDHALAGVAEALSGRRVLIGDFRTVDLGQSPTVVVGNPPFHVELIDAFIGRSHGFLPEGGRVGFLLPAYFFQTNSRLVRYAERWSVRYEMVPRDAFHARLSIPILFAVFTKDRIRRLWGFGIWREAAEIAKLHPHFREVLRDGRPHRSAWRGVVESAIEVLGGEATLSQIYDCVSGRRPTENQHWREKVRQMLQLYFVRTRSGCWTFKEAV